MALIKGIILKEVHKEKSKHSLQKCAQILNMYEYWAH